ncbi:MAG: RICIN domain-containing protein [Clostridia bacterium]|nr:RICIN domain-containing protein [Clostridia bacterium]
MSKSIKRVLAFILTLTMLLSISVMGATAASTSYNPDKALSYAKSHWNDGKGLCAEFVSDCLKAGGFTAVYNVNARQLGQKLQSYGKKINCSGWSSSSCFTSKMFGYSLSKGDVIVWENSSGSSSGHVALYSGETNSKGQILVYAHNRAKNKDVLMPTSNASKCYAIHLNGYTTSTSSSSSASSVSTSLKQNTWYCMTNTKSNKLLNVYGSRSASNTNVTVYQKDNTSGQAFKLVAHGSKTFNGKTYTKYVVVPKCASSCALNVYGTTSKNGSNVNIWTKSGNSTQDWIFEAVSGGYVIRSANNTSYVLTATGTSNSSNVSLSTYSSGNKAQIWKIA